MGLSLIERMIDNACGVGPGYEPPTRDLVTLRCPKCKKKKQVDRESHDLPGTAIVEVMCPDCNEGDFDAVSYFRADGTQILEG